MNSPTDKLVNALTPKEQHVLYGYWCLMVHLFQPDPYWINAAKYMFNGQDFWTGKIREFSFRKPTP